LNGPTVAPNFMKIDLQQIQREKQVIDSKVNEAMAAIRAGADSFPGLTHLLWRQRELAELISGDSNA
jgi:hypothetical protein